MVEPVLFAGARGGEEDGLAVWIPFEHPIGRAMVREALWQTAGGGHDVNIDVAIIIAAESDLRAVRRKARESFLPLRRAEPQGFAAALRRDPDVARIHKGDLSCGNIRVPKHPRIHPAGGEGLGSSGF